MTRTAAYRPCPHGRKGLPLDPGCGICRKVQDDPAYAELWSNPRPQGKDAAVPPVVTDACQHRGLLVPLEQRYSFSLGVIRDWYECKAGYGEIKVEGKTFSCPCRTCNSLCEGYKAGSSDLTVS